MPNKSITTIYDHYKDTCSIVGEAIKRRDRLLVFVIIILGLFSFRSIFPGVSDEILNGFLNFKFGVSLEFNFSIIGNVIWFLLLIFTLRYFQVATFVEQRYPYLYKLESRLNKELGEDIITREGKAYLSNYPRFSDWMWFLYTIIFPFLLFLITIVKIVSEFKNVLINGWSPWFTLDAIAFILLAVSIVLYLIILHKKIK